MSHNGKELIYRVFRHEEVPVLPWVPYAGIHAGKVKGYTAPEVLQDGEKLLESLLEINRLYAPDGQTVMFDLQLEAEILGCQLGWSDTNLPSVDTHPLENSSEIPDRIPRKDEGRLPMVLDTIAKFREKVGDTTALYGLYCGPFTLASHLKGLRLIKNMKHDQENVHGMLDYTRRIAEAMTDYYVEAGIDIIVPVDPLMSQISPRFFEKFFLKPYTKLFDYIRDKGKFSAFFVCGDASHNIESMCRCGPDAIAVDENVDMIPAKRITNEYNIVLGGNIPLTSVMLFGNQMDNMKYTVDLIDRIDAEGLDSMRNLIISPGCDMPYAIPPENAIGVAQAAHDTESIRETIKNYETTNFDDIEVELPDYARLDRPLMEVYTLDPIACAACTYMLAAATEVKEHFGDAIDMVEYRYNERENIARVQKVGVTCLPSIYINGELKFPSLIPGKEELVAELEKVM